MKINLTGVLNDGTPLEPGVPKNPRANVNVPHGADVEFVVTVITNGGIPVPLTGDGTDLLLTVKKRPENQPASIVKGPYSVAGNVATFMIGPGDTKRLSPGLYGYDVWLTKDGVRDTIIPLSPFQLQHANPVPPAHPPPPVIRVTEGDTNPSVLDFSPVNITGWTIVVLVDTPTPVSLPTTIPVGTDGLALFNTTTLPVGKWGATVKSTDLVPTTKTSEKMIIEVLAAIIP